MFVCLDQPAMICKTSVFSSIDIMYRLAFTLIGLLFKKFESFFAVKIAGLIESVSCEFCHRDIERIKLLPFLRHLYVFLDICMVF